MSVKVPFVDLASQHAEVADEVEAGIAAVFAATAFVDGPPVAAFEQQYADFVGVDHCVGVANGTDALELALRAAGVGPGGEVVVQANTFVATAEAQAHDAYKQALAAAAPGDTMIIKRTLGMPGRVLRSPHAEAIVAAEAAGASKDEIVAMIAGAVNARGTDAGDLAGSYVWAGQCVGLFDQVETAGEVVARMAAEAAEGLARLRGCFA